MRKAGDAVTHGFVRVLTLEGVDKHPGNESPCQNRFVEESDEALYPCHSLKRGCPAHASVSLSSSAGLRAEKLATRFCGRKVLHERNAET